MEIVALKELILNVLIISRGKVSSSNTLYKHVSLGVSPQRLQNGFRQSRSRLTTIA